jgi:hypothetical protein
MRKMLMTLVTTTAILFGGALAWQADAAPWSGAAKLGAAAKTATQVEVVACNGTWVAAVRESSGPATVAVGARLMRS